MLDKLAYMLGGRAAEEMVFHDPTTGAGNDIEKATALARAMVTQYGMTERLGAIQLGKDNGEPFLGRDIGHSRNYSEDIAAIVDEETKKLLATAHQEAFDILEENRDVLDALVLALLDQETLDKEEVADDLPAAAAAARRGRPGPAPRTVSRRRSRPSRSPRDPRRGTLQTGPTGSRAGRLYTAARSPAATCTATPPVGGAPSLRVAAWRRITDARRGPDRGAPEAADVPSSTTPAPRRPSASC